jgi:integrase
MGHLPLHTKWILATGFYTGMRLEEIVALTWDKVSLRALILIGVKLIGVLYFDVFEFASLLINLLTVE